MLAVPLALFYTRSPYDCLSYALRERKKKQERARLIKVARRDLLFSRRFGTAYYPQDELNSIRCKILCGRDRKLTFEAYRELLMQDERRL